MRYTAVKQQKSSVIGRRGVEKERSKEGKEFPIVHM